jgi:CheY-like chemotaxis protein
VRDTAVLDRDPSVAAWSPLVLIVEDDAETRLFYTAVFAAHNGFQALEKARAALPDLILLDIAVPGIDGIELCRRLRADVRTCAIPLLAITGYTDRQYHERAIGAGVDHVLNKPSTADVLLEEAHRLLIRQPG